MKHFSLPKDGGLIEAGIPKDILHSYEKIPAEIFDEPDAASDAIAEIIVSAVREHKGGVFRLGLTTGATPVTLYRELVRLYNEGRVSFADVEVFSIDEYYPAVAAGSHMSTILLNTVLISTRPLPVWTFW